MEVEEVYIFNAYPMAREPCVQGVEEDDIWNGRRVGPRTNIEGWEISAWLDDNRAEISCFSKLTSSIARSFCCRRLACNKTGRLPDLLKFPLASDLPS